MGMVVSVESMFVLGGFPLSLKQYKRTAGSDGRHKLSETFLEQLCYPECGQSGRGDGKATKHCPAGTSFYVWPSADRPKAWDGRIPAVRGHDNYNWAHSGLEAAWGAMHSKDLAGGCVLE